VNEEIKINELIDKYISENASEYYKQNIDKLNKQAKEVSEFCDTLLYNGQDSTLIDANFITVEEGLTIIKEYLQLIDPKLVEDFNNKIINGNVEFNNDDSEDSYCEYYDEEHNEKINILISTNGWTYDSMAALMHEFIHSVNFNLSKDKSFARFNVIFSEFFSIYFELDFLNFVREKMNYNFALANLYNRYNHIVMDVQEYYCMSWLVNEKMENGVIDKYTNQISETPLEEETFENLLKNVDKAEKYFSKFFPHIYFGYFIGVPLAYTLIKKEDIDMPKKVYEMMKEMGNVTLQETFEKVGLDANFLENMNFAEIYDSIANDIVMDSQKQL